MAPFNTHFLIAEKIWPDLPPGPWQDYYGQFCFGCVAPDVDKASEVLTQRDTHFFDRSGDYEAMASRRTATFLTGQDEFLRCPFSELPGEAQAFVLGYLCHLSVDEVSKHMWRRPTWQRFHHVRATSAFAVLDELARSLTGDYEAIADAICHIEVVDVLRHISVVDLQRMQAGVCTFVRAKSSEAEYLALVDLFDNPSPEARQAHRERFRQEIDIARQQVQFFNLNTLVRAGVAHSRQRLGDLIAGRRPEPGYPLLEQE